MTDKDLDEYLSGDDGVKIEVVNRTQAVDELPAITLQANDVNERKIKIEHGAIQSILRGSDTKIDKKQSLDLFGKCLADTKDKPEIDTPEPNLADYADVFGEGRAPQVADLPAGAYCILETEMVSHPTTPYLGLKQYKCVNCGRVYKKPKWEIKDPCPGKSSNSETGLEQ
jgi:hypothetical protein